MLLQKPRQVWILYDEEKGIVDSSVVHVVRHNDSHQIEVPQGRHRLDVKVVDHELNEALLDLVYSGKD